MAASPPNNNKSNNNNHYKETVHFPAVYVFRPSVRKWRSESTMARLPMSIRLFPFCQLAGGQASPSQWIITNNDPLHSSRPEVRVITLHSFMYILMTRIHKIVSTDFLFCI
jgi:hypothetical protein